MTDQTEGTESAEKQNEETLDYNAELAKLNDEFSQDQQEQTHTEKPEETSEIAALRAEINSLKTHIQGDQTEKAINDALKVVKGDTDLTISDRYLRKLVVGEVSDNPTLMRAYMGRQQNPGAWQKALKAMGKEFQRDFGKKDTTDTNDIEAVEASVRAQHSSDRPKSIPKLTGNESPAEYAEWRKNALG